jgi:hypothetical protein
MPAWIAGSDGLLAADLARGPLGALDASLLSWGLIHFEGAIVEV